MALTASDPRKSLFSLIQRANDNHEAIEILSKIGTSMTGPSSDESTRSTGGVTPSRWTGW
ncbi:hypothetical protein [Psychromicrobium sp. YIM B11713]|uniref:hypothetical protein n=1 Tax=Psychromicrobium sp. YIM B11713 TaxID=3145233 RepID=UPI00374E64B7